ncbi:hypothetical protein FNH05_32900 [Amycolatopsis rhizosphaerae]|uniref:Integrase SAM-like N-terminal domain-containing protein n=1 Tax=Amycolatopsis rhizosphaerae TaxID=2053003 RepID=A0A558AHL6_9PSEU|nr:hypothetical protein [Amycolatopsis rhizosphaerae]TVT23750.1 hypothetical protein FNH05_32900 [Amycolatopsis rhizosphaerae]
MATDQRRGTWVDPAAGRTTLAQWVACWLPALDLDERTLESYRSRLRCHSLPRFGHAALGAPELPQNEQQKRGVNDHPRSNEGTRKPLRPVQTTESKGITKKWA